MGEPVIKESIGVRLLPSVCMIVLMLLSFNAIAGAHKIISKIIFIGNEITQQSVLRREMYVAEGDVVDLKKINESTQGIMDLGLFRDVTYHLEVDGNDINQCVLYINIKEKYYKFILPRLRFENSQWRTGLQIRWDNLNGLDHSLQLLAERMGSEQGVSELRQRFRYKYPNILGSKFSADLRLVNQNKIDASIDGDFQNQIEQSFELGIFKWLNKQHRKNGWYARIGFDLRTRDFESLQDQSIVDASQVIQLSFKYAYKNVHEYLYNRGGKHYGYEIKIADAAFGSKSQFISHYFFYQSYYQFKSRPNDNLNVQTLLGYSNNNILGDRAFTLDYRNGLRGYERSRFQGNSLLVVNTEYLQPSPWYNTLRLVYFIDMGTTGNSLGDAFRGPLKTGVGFGFRWKVPAFVHVDLRLDIGYGISDDNVRVTVGTKHAF